MNFKFTRYAGNPILKPNANNQWENLCVLNPAVIFDDKTNKFVMIYRAGGDEIKHNITSQIKIRTGYFSINTNDLK